MEELVSVADAAEILNTSERYVEGLIESGTLSRVRGRGILIPLLRKSDVLAYRAQDDEVRRAMAAELSRMDQEL